MKITNKFPAIFIVIGSAVLMQIHGIAFWVGQTGDTGIAWSIMLEAAALWLWWQNRIFLAVIASALVIAGPLYQISSPVINSMRSAEINKVMITANQDEIKQLSASISRYDSNSAERLGWHDRIDRTHTDLNAARARLRESLKKAEENENGWQARSLIVLEGFALLIVMLTQIQAVKHLRIRPEMPDFTYQKPVKPIESPILQNRNPEIPEPGITETDLDRLAITVAKTIREKLPEFGGKQKDLAEYYRFRAPSVSLVLNHQERRAAGKETVTKSALLKMAEALGVL